MRLLLLTVLVVLLASDIYAEKVRKHKKYRKRPNPLEEESREVVDSEEKAPDAPPLVADDVIDNRVPLIGINNVLLLDPCLQVRCGAGRICEVDSEGEPQCVCIPNCPVEKDSRRKVCSNHNETWSSDCAVYQQRCLCDKGDPQCKGEQYKHVHIEYYGECRDMPECTKEEMSDFPRRMRDWLFNIMRDLADRQELTPHYLTMEREAESNMTRRWTNAAIWKFCELDGHPPDRSVSRHELFPIRAPLMALEHCIAPFLNSCDSDNNHRITIKEWAKCLQLEEDEIEDRCEEIAEEE
ncbi:hypothetical protein NQ315_008375 [Exocentrus adspersus]|uniref:Follistatin-like domain-containing protein n=1 Tax=Exocentrus adspersus TaxID=1586481 RepID=A0AAV8VSA8_9CUCU|nr:hypothetical protein NQ315_008375 [Exocentrus adspersus]